MWTPFFCTNQNEILPKKKIILNLFLLTFFSSSKNNNYFKYSYFLHHVKEAKYVLSFWIDMLFVGFS